MPCAGSTPHVEEEKMGKPVKTHRKKTYNYNKNRRRAWKNSKKLPNIECEQLKNAWDEKKSMEQNLREMGLSSDPNKTLPIPSAKDLLTKPEANVAAQAKTEPLKPSVIHELEKEANQELEKTLRLSSSEVKYCIYMMEKYGEDYKAMARDPKNHYQDTPKQIRKKIATFKSIPLQYEAYVQSKQDGSPQSF